MRRQLRDGALRGCSALGLVAGLLWGLQHQAHVTCARAGSAANTLNRCTSHSITAIATHWGLARGGGLLLGGAVGVVLALMIEFKTA